MGYKEEFIDIYTKNIKRDGSQKLLEWMQTTDFFTAPASTKFHGACEHGLVMHSISVYKTMMERHFEPEKDSTESFAICMVEDAFPYGHGEKSVFLVERFMRLKPSEAMAIRWHMGGFDEAARGGSFAISLAYEKYPLAVKLHLADLESTYLKEKNTSSVH